MYEVPVRGGEPRVILEPDGVDVLDFHDVTVGGASDTPLYTVHAARARGGHYLETLTSGETTKVFEMPSSDLQNPG